MAPDLNHQALNNKGLNKTGIHHDSGFYNQVGRYMIRQFGPIPLLASNLQSRHLPNFYNCLIWGIFLKISSEGGAGMRRLLKISGILVALLAALLILAVVVINLVPGKQYKNLVSSVLKDATGRDLVIEGDLDITLFTAFSFTASDVKFANAEWGSRPHMLTIDRIEGEVALFPLIKGILDVSLVVDRPDLLLETHSSGRGNWHFGEVAEIVKETVEAAEKVVQTKAQTDKVAGLPLRLRIRKLQINDTRFAYNDSNSEDQIKDSK